MLTDSEHQVDVSKLTDSEEQPVAVALGVSHVQVALYLVIINLGITDATKKVALPGMVLSEQYEHIQDIFRSRWDATESVRWCRLRKKL